MTERQRALLEALPKYNNILSKAAESVGYSKSTSNSSIYGLVRNSKGLERKSEEDVKRDYLRKIAKLQKRLRKLGDSTNEVRCTEIEGKVKGLFKDSTIQTQGNTIIIDRQGLIGTPGKADPGIAGATPPPPTGEGV
jgi:hypothetical protein